MRRLLLCVLMSVASWAWTTPDAAYAYGLGVTQAYGPGATHAYGPGAASPYGPGTTGLGLTVTVNARPGTEAVRHGIRTHAPVVTTYHLTNRAGADLYGIRVLGPPPPRARVPRPRGGSEVRLLTGLRSVRCTAAGRARPGTWTGTVRATGRQPHLNETVRAHARAGYAGVGAGLRLTESARVTGARAAEVRYTLTNPGNRALHDIRLTDSALAPARISCAGGRAVVARLSPGATVHCTARVTRAPGRYTSHGTAVGNDRLRTLTPQGRLARPANLTARATARFTLPAPPPPRSRPVRPATPPPPSTAPVPRPPVTAPVVVPPPAEALALLMPPPGAAAVLGAVPPPPAVPLPPAAVAPPFVAPAAPPALLPAVPPGLPPAMPPAVPPAVNPPGDPPAAQTPARNPLLGLFVRPDHSPTGLGLLTALFLVLLPAALAAAVLGARRR